MRGGKLEAANALAKQIQKQIAKSSTSTFANPIRNARDLWDRVRNVTGKGKKGLASDSDFNADQLNKHYSQISTDANYAVLAPKITAHKDKLYISEEEVFKLLDGLKPTSPGLDNIPSWFLRISAPYLSRHLARLYNISLNRSEVPKQWKASIITPVAKCAKPTSCCEYRPISITPIVSRVLEKIIVRKFLYPVLTNPEHSLLFKDQFAFRPTGSTTAALIYLTHILAEMLEIYPFVHLISLDFSRAFDTVRHSTLLQKTANLPIQDEVYNWFIDYFDGRKHSTKFNGETSTFCSINCSIVQGSGKDPVK